jgi:hypothetical protein
MQYQFHELAGRKPDGDERIEQKPFAFLTSKWYTARRQDQLSILAAD